MYDISLSQFNSDNKDETSTRIDNLNDEKAGPSCVNEHIDSFDVCTDYGSDSDFDNDSAVEVRKNPGNNSSITNGVKPTIDHAFVEKSSDITVGTKNIYQTINQYTIYDKNGCKKTEQTENIDNEVCRTDNLNETETGKFLNRFF